jgi:hypothetical protein
MLLVLAAGLLAGGLGSVVGAASMLALKTNTHLVASSLAAPAVGTGNLDLQADSNINLTSQHVRIVGRDGNFEFEHAATSPASTLTAYNLGTPTRTPIEIGGADQDVLSLLVNGKPDQTNDLQEWAAGGKPLLAVDSRGRLRFGDVTLWVTNRNGTITFYAQAAGQPTRVLSRTGR